MSEELDECDILDKISTRSEVEEGQIMAGRSVAPSKENMHLQALQPKNRGPGPCVSVGFRSLHFSSLLFTPSLSRRISADGNYT